jgi:murein L,D-transpeptidase YcbB/YkuD
VRHPPDRPRRRAAEPAPRRLPAGVLALWLGLAAAPAQAAIDEAIRSELAAAPQGRSPAVVDAVRAQWAERRHAPRFVAADPPHRPTAQADAALQLLLAARDRGLDPAAYDAAALRAAVQAAEPPGSEAAAARLEARLALAFGQFLADAGFGRVDPRTLGHDLPQQRRRDAMPATLRRALAGDDPDAALAAVEPTLPSYAALLRFLAQQRRLAALPAPAPLPAVRARVSPGDAWVGVPALRERLVRGGDLAADAPPVDTYDGVLVDAVRAFQRRHGLDDDGVLGRQTLAALDVPAANRVRQIELTLERLRWLGGTPRGRFVAVNIPEYRLWAVGADGRPVRSMAVVVGRSVTGTPVFVDAIEALELNPYWNVPRSIASKELYPKIARNPGWLESQHMELIGAAGDDLHRALASGAARLRQRPGPDNALGRVKFVMPNGHDVYLHDTPARALFARSRRDFSHGCIRVERPFDLAAFALADVPEWPPSRVEAAVADGRHQVIRLPAPIPVLIFYATVNVGADGRPRFLADVYGHDARLDAVLRAR